MPAEHFSRAGLAVFKRISWGAVLAGTVIALVSQLLLTLLGLGIGLGTVDPVEEANPMAGLGTASVIWWSVSMLISLFIGGWCAGRLAGMPKSSDSTLHGVLAFCLFTLLSFYLVTTAIGRVISSVGNVLGKTVSLAGQGLAAAAPEMKEAAQDQLQKSNIDLSSIKNEASELLAQTGKPELQPRALKREAREAKQEVKSTAKQAGTNPQAADENADQTIDRLFAKGEDLAKEVDREAVVNVIVERTGKSRAEANKIADNWIATFNNAKTQVAQKTEEAKAKAEKAADDAASAASKSGIFGFVGLLLGACAAGFGGRAGRPRDLVTEVSAPAF